jgi:serine/threonine-protein kinase
MTSERDRWNRLQSLFEGAVALQSFDREAYLDSHCSDDPELRSQVESLIAASESASNALGGAVRAVARDLARPLESGQRIGPWELMREVGHGGMGAVFLARRADGEYQAEVAVKLIGGPRTAEHLRRFRAERQILASLDHPNIARMLGGGTTADGIPWVAMEYIDGIPLDRYCQEHRLAIDARLAIFRDVCRAVRYAHQHLVVHRDLKPGNILVSADGTAKLLDFGIAKLLAPGDADASQTGTAMRLLTPAYASPEQLRGGAITVATDVYGLGVVLFLLLTGKLPHDVAGKSLAEIERLVCEEPPPRPSSLVPVRDSRRLRGDLDTIVLMALQKDPRRRYESVERLADDIERHLTARPVLARGETTAYRLGRFLRRHRTAVVVASAAVLMLAAFGVTMGIQARRLAVERDAATTARANAEQVSTFLASVFESSDPDESRGQQLTARELLDRGAKRVRTELAAQPAVQATMMRVIGDVYGALGLRDESRPLLEESLAKFRALYGDDHPEVATSKLALGVLYKDIGDVKAAEPLYRAALAVRRRELGPDHASIAEVLSELAYLLQTNGDNVGAEELFREALAMERRVYPAGDAHVASSMTKLARSLRESQKLGEAESLLREALAVQRVTLGNDHPDVASTLRNLSSVLRDRGGDARFEADTLLQEAIALRRRVLGPDHPETANTLNSYGLLLSSMGETQRAIAVYREFIAILDRIHSTPHPDQGAAYNNIAASLREDRQYAEAEQFYRRSARVTEQVLAPGHPNRAFPLVGLGGLFMEQRRWTDAETYYRRALAIRRAALPAGHRYIGETLSDLGAALLEQRRFGEARRHLTDALAILRAAEGDEGSRTRRAVARIARLDQATGATQAGQPR